MPGNGIDVRQMNVRDMVQTLTGGRPYVFVIMAYSGEREGVYQCIADVTDTEFGVGCIRADHVNSSGYDLLAKIHYLIRRAEVVIAEISEWSPNVFYEIGYAVASQKPPLLVIERNKPVPTDLKGLELIEYDNRFDGIADFKKGFCEHLRFRMNSELAILRDMLEAPTPQPSYIVSSPKYPGKHSRLKGQVYDSRTFGDHLGILGLVSAFGSVWGAGQGVELISAKHAPPDLLEREINLYLIGSRKCNTKAGDMLRMIQRHREPTWSFGPAEGFKATSDWPVRLYRTVKGVREEVIGKIEKLGEKQEEVWTEDYGIIVRAPHPNYPGRLAMILAGAHSLGTGAACLAATRSPLIQQIRNRLPTGVLEDKASSFWVLAKGEVSRKDFLLDEEGVTIEDAGVYE